MKLIINYDLVDKIKEAKKGISLIKSSKKILLKSSLAEIVFIITSLAFNYSIDGTAKNSIPAFCAYLALYWMLETIHINKNKVKALNDLKKIVIHLKDLNVCTDFELFMESYVYEKEYKLVNKDDSSLPKINQKKYIMVPVYNDGEIKEVSLVQEHIIGSKYYVISYGEPNKQKVFKPVFGSI